VTRRNFSQEAAQLYKMDTPIRCWPAMVAPYTPCGNHHKLFKINILLKSEARTGEVIGWKVVRSYPRGFLPSPGPGGSVGRPLRRPLNSSLQHLCRGRHWAGRRRQGARGSPLRRQGGFPVIHSRQSSARIDKYSHEDQFPTLRAFRCWTRKSFDGLSRTRLKNQSSDSGFLESATQPRTSPAQPVILP